MRRKRSVSAHQPIIVQGPQKTGLLSATIGIATVVVSLVGIWATYSVTENSRKDRLLFERNAALERAALRDRHNQAELLSAKIAALRELQQVYGELQNARLMFVRRYLAYIGPVAQLLIRVELKNEYLIDDEAAVKQSIQAVIEASEDVERHVNHYRNAVSNTFLLFRFGNVEFPELKEVIARSQMGRKMQKHIALLRNQFTPVYRKAIKSAKAGVADPEFGPQLLSVSTSACAEIRNDMFSLDIDLDKQQASLVEKCWHSIIADRDR